MLAAAADPPPPNKSPEEEEEDKDKKRKSENTITTTDQKKPKTSSQEEEEEKTSPQEEEERCPRKEARALLRRDILAMCPLGDPNHDVFLYPPPIPEESDKLTDSTASYGEPSQPDES